MSSTQPRVYSVSEAMRITGLSRQTLMRRVRRGELTAYSLGGPRSLRVNADEIDAMLRPLPIAAA